MNIGDKEISLEERKKIQLQMLIEIDAFCKKNNIRYSLAYGTLIGAIRHKGFIPWDDDVDLIIPLKDMKLFKEKLNLPDIEYCDIDTDDDYEYAFSRLAYKPTYSRRGLSGKSYGVNIDFYPLVPIPSNVDAQKKFFKKVKKWSILRLWLLRLNKRVIKILPIKQIPLLHFAVKHLRDSLFSFENMDSDTFYSVSGPYYMKDREIFHENLFEKLVEVEFEGHNFLAVSVYDKWLRKFYGDYMQLPPIEERVPYHGGHYFWK